MVQLVSPNQFQLTPDVSKLATGFQQGQQIRGQFEDRKARASEDNLRSSRIRALALDQGLTALQSVPLEDRPRVFGLMDKELRTAGIDPKVFADSDFSDKSLSEAKASVQGLIDEGVATPAGLAEFNALTGGLSRDERQKAMRIRLGLDPRAGSSAEERIAVSPSLTEQVATSRGVIAQETESGKARGKAAGEASTANLVAKTKSTITKAVKVAEAKAKAEGEALTDLNRAEAALPALTGVVDQLKELAPIATSTLGGKIFDTAVKESGFGATKGATARAKFGAIVNNQILPLLKQTFGSAFTVDEKNELKATMGDLDASPAEKIAQLDAFIAAKRRQIDTTSRELGLPASGGRAVSEMSDEELLQIIGGQ